MENEDEFDPFIFERARLILSEPPEFIKQMVKDGNEKAKEIANDLKMIYHMMELDLLLYRMDTKELADSFNINIARKGDCNESHN